MTNLVFRAEGLPSPYTSAIIRVSSAGKNPVFSRRQERNIFLAASRLRIGPRCLLEFNNGRIEELIPGDVGTAQTMRQPEEAAAIARALAEFNTKLYEALPLSKPEKTDGALRGSSPRADEGGDKVTLWDRLRGWLATALEVAPQEASELGLDDVAAEIELMKKAIRQKFGPPWLGFCHNDMQYGNILLQEEEGKLEDDKSRENTSNNKNKARIIARLIDYEYAAVSDVAFDLANHFCEYAADYSSEDSVLDWNRLASEIEKERFCESYVAALLDEFADSRLAGIVRAAAGSTAHGGEELKKVVSRALIERASAHMPLSDLKWGLWGLIQSKLSEVTYDYLAYARLRLERYHKTKTVLLQHC